MNYQKIYNQLIEKRRIEVLSKKEVYCETHHIVAKCMGGSDDKSNLVNLTAREHFLAHWLLHRVYPNNYKLSLAFFRCCYGFSKNRKFTPSSRAYEEIKKLKRIVPIEVKNKISNGLNASEKFKASFTKKRSLKISNSLMGHRPWSKNKKFINRKKQERTICIKCNHCFSLTAINAFHNEKCTAENRQCANINCNNIFYVSHKNNTKAYCSKKCSAQCRIRSKESNIKRSNTLKRRKNKTDVCTYCKHENLIQIICKYHNENCEYKIKNVA